MYHRLNHNKCFNFVKKEKLILIIRIAYNSIYAVKAKTYGLFIRQKNLKILCGRQIP